MCPIIIFGKNSGNSLIYNDLGFWEQEKSNTDLISVDEQFITAV